MYFCVSFFVTNQRSWNHLGINRNHQSCTLLVPEKKKVRVGNWVKGEGESWAHLVWASGEWVKVKVWSWQGRRRVKDKSQHTLYERSLSEWMWRCEVGGKEKGEGEISTPCMSGLAYQYSNHKPRSYLKGKVSVAFFCFVFTLHVYLHLHPVARSPSPSLPLSPWFETIPLKTSET